MQYEIEKTEVALNESDLDYIEAKIGLSLPRFSSLITKCAIRFEEKNLSNENLIVCTIRIGLIKNHDIVISDRAQDLQTAFSLVLGRIKRNIERSIKRQSMSRTSNTLNL